MSNFFIAMCILKALEYSDCSDALHKNPTEPYYTFMGITQKYHPDSIIWKKVAKEMRLTHNIEAVSKILCNDPELIDEVYRIYKKEYWDKAKLDLVKSQKIATEIFIFGVNADMEQAIKQAQRIVGVKDDGVVGPITLKALNEFSPEKFDILYDQKEKQYYTNLAIRKPIYKIYLNSWLRRAEEV